MDACKRCHKRFDYTDKRNTKGIGLIAYKAICPFCNQYHRIDYLSGILFSLFSILLAIVAFLFWSQHPDYLLPKEIKIAILAIGLIGVAISLKITKLVKREEKT